MRTVRLHGTPPTRISIIAGLPSTGTRPNRSPVIVNEVVVPADLPAGRYVLGFRWDCEGTSQIWASCSDVALV